MAGRLLTAGAPRALGVQASVAVAQAQALRLSCFEACGIFPDQGLNPPCFLPWQVDSPLS